MRFSPREAVTGRAFQCVPFFRERLAAGACLLDGGLQRGQRGQVLLPAAAGGPDAGVGAAQFVAAGVEFARGFGERCVQFRDPALDRLPLGRRRRCLLVQAGPSHRVGPAEPYRPAALVTRTGRCTLPAERVSGVQPPQAPVVTQPGCLVVDEHRVPRDRLAGPHGGAVTTAIVNERDAERGAGVRPRPRQQEPAQAAQRPEHSPQGGWLDGDQIIPRQVGPRVRPGAGEDHRVRVPPLEVGVVRPAPQVVAGLIVGGEGDPGRPGRRVRRIRQENGHLLPVGLVVVDAAEGRPPVVHRVEEPVLQRHETPVAGDPAVVRAADRVGARPVLLLGRGRRPAGHPPAQQQRQPHDRVDEPAQQADYGEPATPGRQPRAALVAPPRAELAPAERVLHET